MVINQFTTDSLAQFPFPFRFSLPLTDHSRYYFNMNSGVCKWSLLCTISSRWQRQSKYSGIPIPQCLEKVMLFYLGEDMHIFKFQAFGFQLRSVSLNGKEARKERRRGENGFHFYLPRRAQPILFQFHTNKAQTKPVTSPPSFRHHPKLKPSC